MACQNLFSRRHRATNLDRNCITVQSITTIKYMLLPLQNDLEKRGAVRVKTTTLWFICSIFTLNMIRRCKVTRTDGTCTPDRSRRSRAQTTVSSVPTNSTNCDWLTPPPPKKRPFLLLGAMLEVVPACQPRTNWEFNFKRIPFGNDNPDRLGYKQQYKTCKLLKRPIKLLFLAY